MTRKDRYTRGERIMEDQWIDAFIDRLAAIKRRKTVLCLLIICSRYQVVEESD